MTYPMAPDLAPESAWFKSSHSSENGGACVEVTWVKSSHSGDTGNNCVEVAWLKSSYSQEQGNACVEVADFAATGQVGVRDSKDKTGPALLFPAEAFTAFVTAIRAGHFPV